MSRFLVPFPRSFFILMLSGVISFLFPTNTATLSSHCWGMSYYLHPYLIYCHCFLLLLGRYLLYLPNALPGAPKFFQVVLLSSSFNTFYNYALSSFWDHPFACLISDSFGDISEWGSTENCLVECVIFLCTKSTHFDVGCCFANLSVKVGFCGMWILHQ